MTTATLVSLLIALLILGAILYLVQLVPIDGTVKQIIKVLAILIVVIYVILLLARLLPGVR